MRLTRPQRGLRCQRLCFFTCISRSARVVGVQHYPVMCIPRGYMSPRYRYVGSAVLDSGFAGMSPISSCPHKQGHICAGFLALRIAMLAPVQSEEVYGAHALEYSEQS